ncbi:MAG: sigma factor [Mycobacterium sp.]
MTYDKHAASLMAAQSGDEQAFAELTGRYAVELHTHCYRMLGSVHDADEALQDVWLRAWRGLGGFTDAARSVDGSTASQRMSV